MPVRTILNRVELARITKRLTVVEDGCWLWNGPLTPNGYATFRVHRGGGQVVVHRALYEHYVGPIPEGLQADHLCRVRRCCNPAHLELVSPSTNTERQDHANRRKTTCVNGHDLTDASNVRLRRGRRECLACDRARKRF